VRNTNKRGVTADLRGESGRSYLDGCSPEPTSGWTAMPQVPRKLRLDTRNCWNGTHTW